MVLFVLLAGRLGTQLPRLNTEKLEEMFQRDSLRLLGIEMPAGRATMP